MGNANCGTQLKISALMSGTVAGLLAYNYITSHGKNIIKLLKYVGDISFGIFFSHIAVMRVLSYISMYKSFAFPLKAIITVVVSSAAVLLGRKILGKHSYILAL